GEALLAARYAGDDEEHYYRDQHRKQRRNDHFLDRSIGDKIDGARVVRANRAIHDARIVAELRADFLDDGAAGTTDRHHSHRTEEVGQERAQKQADDDVWIGQAEVHVGIGNAEVAGEPLKIR